MSLSLAAAPSALKSVGARRCGRGVRRAAPATPARCVAEPECVSAPSSSSSRRAVLLGVVALPLVTAAPPSLATQLVYGSIAAAPSKVFVAGATGQTGRRVVAQLRAAGVAVRAGARDIKKAESLGFRAAGAEIMRADVTDGVEALVQAIGDADAVVCATGFTPSLNFSKDNAKAVDGAGTRALIDAAKKAGVRKVVMVSSLLTNSKETGQTENPNYKFLNAFGGILDEKRDSERYLEASGLDWTIVRPGGLSNDLPSVLGPPLIAGADTFFGLPEEQGREVSRDTVAEIAVAALSDPLAANAIFEVVASPTAPPKAREDFFKR